VVNIKLKNPILREVGALSRVIHAIVELEFKSLGLLKGQFLYLSRICENPGINQIQLSNLLKVDKTNTTKVLNKLESENFIYKTKNEKDKRSYLLYPTNKALEVYESIIIEENRNIDICFQNFNDEEKKSAYDLIKKMRINMESDWNNFKTQ